MAWAKTDYIFREIKGRGLIDRIARFTTPRERINEVNQLLMEINITKCTLTDIDIEEPGGSSYLLFRIQDEYKMDMGICPFYKAWFNRYGKQERCWFNRGSVQVHCTGNISRCEHGEEYAAYKDLEFSAILSELEKLKAKK